MTKSRLNFQLSIALFLLLCAASLDFLVISARADNTAVSTPESAAIPAKADSHLSVEGLSQRVQCAVEKVRPSLVSITGTTRGPIVTPLLPEFSNTDFTTFNDQTLLPAVFRMEPDRSGLGTGVIISEDGYIWTSSGIVHGLDSVAVTLPGNTSCEGKVIFDDPESGLAIVKIDEQRLPAAKLGDTTKVKPADWTVAVALDDSHEPNLALGMISSCKRSKAGSTDGAIRCSLPVATDFAGCAVVNLDGEVIGINVKSPSSKGTSVTGWYALDTASAKELHHKAMQLAMVSDQEAAERCAVSTKSAQWHGATQRRKEGELSQIEMISRLFSAPSSEWTSGSIASSVRNWLGSWPDANRPLTLPASNASESR